MRKRMHRRRIGEIIRRHIHRLNRGDRAGVGVGDALLQSRQLRAHRGLITQARRHLSHQAGDFHAGLDETKNIINEQQDIAMFIVAEILGHRQRRVAHAEPAARRLVHLAENHHHVRQHTGGFHLAVKFLAFATTFADAAKNTDALLMPDHVVDHFREQNRLAHACAAKKSRLAAAFQRHQHVNDLDARLENFRLGGTPRQRRRRAMHRTPLHVRRRRLPVNGVAKHVKHPRENGLADGRFQWPARIRDHHAARQPLRGRQRDPAHMARIALRQHFDDNFVFGPRLQHRVNRRQRPIKAHIHDAAAHRSDRAEIG